MPAQETATPDAIDAFIAKWKDAEASERANAQSFLIELCDLLGVEHPQPTGANNQGYVFERAIHKEKPDGTVTTVFADCYKAGHFMLETKQGSYAKQLNPGQRALLDEGVFKKVGHGKRDTKAWDTMLERARSQAERYVRALPASEGRPPFLIVCDVGYVLELYSEFSCSGGDYVRFPAPQKHRIYLEDLRKPEIRERLRLIWTNPHALDPAQHAAKVTREVAWHLSELAKSLDGQHEPQIIATFLQRCLFTMFAEDVGLLPEKSFTALLEDARQNPGGFAPLVTQLWKDMGTGSDYCTVVRQKIAYFNGGLFENPSALPLDGKQIAMLLGAAKKDWSEVEPAIFGTLLERALDPHERHKLGAHYTPRSYVERLVKPTVIDPLREQFTAVKGAAMQLVEKGKTTEALDQLHAFHRELCQVRVLDPACGSGNFLYVTLEHMKRLEGEVLELLESLGDPHLTFEMEQFKVRPEQFLGLEINARAVAIAQLVIWIGFFQWQKKTTGSADTREEPLLPKGQTIEHRDAVLDYDGKTLRRDADGNPVTVWDRKTFKIHSVTGKEVPDESARTDVWDYQNPRKPDWPAAHFIVGNPPFIGTARMRDYLGDGYTEALRQTWKGQVPESADFVMFWWEHAAQLLKAAPALESQNQKLRAKGKPNEAVPALRRFGFITTNAIHMTFNRRVLEQHLADSKNPLTLAYAIPDHPWVDSADGAAVRIAMTVATLDNAPGVLAQVTKEVKEDEGDFEVILEERTGKIWPNLKLGADLGSASALQGNADLSNRGVQVIGAGFIVSPAEATKLGLGRIDGLEQHIRGYRNGRDLTDKPRGVMVIDLLGLTESEVRQRYPEVYQHVLTTVKPERDQNKRESYKRYWWIHGEPRKQFRPALHGLPRYIATVETSKHRFFTFLDQSILPDNKLINIALDDAFYFGVISSLVHVTYVLALGSQLGPTPVYVKTTCFETFPFPELPEDDALKQRIRQLGEDLDAHRKARQQAHPELTLTGMYNVLEKLRTETPLNDKEQTIHDDGLVSVLKQLHDELDAAVCQAYGWDDIVEAVSSRLHPGTKRQDAASTLADRLARGDAEAEALEQDILSRLVALNHERAAEEKRGQIRWLRPDYQNPEGTQPAQEQTEADLGPIEDKRQDAASTLTPAVKRPWPKGPSEKFAAVMAAIEQVGTQPADLAAVFGNRTKQRIAEIEGILEILESLGKL